MSVWRFWILKLFFVLLIPDVFWSCVGIHHLVAQLVIPVMHMPMFSFDFEFSCVVVVNFVSVGASMLKSLWLKLSVFAPSTIITRSPFSHRLLSFLCHIYFGIYILVSFSVGFLRLCYRKLDSVLLRTLNYSEIFALGTNLVCTFWNINIHIILRRQIKNTLVIMQNLVNMSWSQMGKRSRSLIVLMRRSDLMLS